jgi:hypothetical protein
MTNEQLGQLAREVLASAELTPTSGVDGVIQVNADLLFKYFAEQGRARREAKYAAERG